MQKKTKSKVLYSGIVLIIALAAIILFGSLWYIFNFNVLLVRSPYVGYEAGYEEANVGKDRLLATTMTSKAKTKTIANSDLYDSTKYNYDEDTCVATDLNLPYLYMGKYDVDMLLGDQEEPILVSVTDNVPPEFRNLYLTLYVEESALKSEKELLDYYNIFDYDTDASYVLTDANGDLDLSKVGAYVLNVMAYDTSGNTEVKEVYLNIISHKEAQSNPRQLTINRYGYAPVTDETRAKVSADDITVDRSTLNFGEDFVSGEFLTAAEFAAKQDELAKIRNSLTEEERELQKEIFGDDYDDYASDYQDKIADILAERESSQDKDQEAVNDFIEDRLGIEETDSDKDKDKDKSEDKEAATDTDNSNWLTTFISTVIGTDTEKEKTSSTLPSKEETSSTLPSKEETSSTLPSKEETSSTLPSKEETSSTLPSKEETSSTLPSKEETISDTTDTNSVVTVKAGTITFSGTNAESNSIDMQSGETYATEDIVFNVATISEGTEFWNCHYAYYTFKYDKTTDGKFKVTLRYYRYLDSENANMPYFYFEKDQIVSVTDTQDNTINVGTLSRKEIHTEGIEGTYCQTKYIPVWGSWAYDNNGKLRSTNGVVSKDVQNDIKTMVNAYLVSQQSVYEQSVTQGYWTDSAPRYEEVIFEVNSTDAGLPDIQEIHLEFDTDVNNLPFLYYENNLAYDNAQKVDNKISWQYTDDNNITKTVTYYLTGDTNDSCSKEVTYTFNFNSTYISPMGVLSPSTIVQEPDEQTEN
jgi:hypothetical protein